MFSSFFSFGSLSYPSERESRHNAGVLGNLIKAGDRRRQDVLKLRHCGQLPQVSRKGGAKVWGRPSWNIGKKPAVCLH